MSPDTVKFVRSFVALGARRVMAWGAAGLTTHGLLAASSDDKFIELGVAAAVGGADLIWAGWQTYGSVVQEIANGYVNDLLARLQAKVKALPHPSPDASPQVKAAVADAKQEAAKAIPAVAAAIAILGLLLVAPDAHAAERIPIPAARPEPPADAASAPVFCDMLNILPGCKSPATGQPVTSDATKAITDIFTNLAKFVDTGVVEAEQLSMAIPDLPDGVGQQCWMQMRKTSAVFKAHPVPLTLQLPLDLQALRLLVMSANDLCASASCTQLFSDAANLATAAAGAGGFSIPIPSLASVCSKIPVLRSTPTVADPTLPATVVTPPVTVPATTPP